jgi:phosphoglucosamine mutase
MEKTRARPPLLAAPPCHKTGHEVRAAHSPSLTAGDNACPGDPKNMSRTYFGTDGIRGTVGTPPITPDFMLRLGHAVGRVLRRGVDRPTVLIGKDTRISGYMLESSLEAGFASAGVDVLLSGPLPTPGVAYLTRALRLDLGVVISASHNAFDDNGVKFFSARGEKLPDQWETDVEAALLETPQWVDSAGLGKARRLTDASGRYIEFCKSTVPHSLSFKGMRIVVDAAHGAAYHVAPDVFHELGAAVVSIGCSPDGTNINAGCGATSPQALVDAVAAHCADYGVALDGDADRLQIVDAQGRLYNGDELLYVMASDRLARGQAVPGVVGTLMTNMAVELALKRLGVPLARAKVGDRYVLEELTARGWQLGGEGSGHLLALDRHTTGDGIVSALQVLHAVRRHGRTLAALLEGVELYPQTLINVRMPPGMDWQANGALQDTRVRVERELGEQGRVLIRASGTEPVLRVMVEARESERAQACARMLAETVAA